MTDDEPFNFYSKVHYLNRLANNPNDSELLDLPFDYDFAEDLFFCELHSDVEQSIWYFYEAPHRMVVIDQLKIPPKIAMSIAVIRHTDNNYYLNFLT